MDLPGEKLVIRLWETLAEKGIGALLRPWQMVREGRAQIRLLREQTVTLAQARRDADDILTGRATLDEHSNLVPTAVPPPALAFEAPANAGPQPTSETTTRYLEATVVADAMRREVNTSKAILHAAAALAEDPEEPPPNKAEEDWLFRWRDHAGSVSSDELQALWGRVLAGEIKTPGSYSLRTLDFLRNLSQAEAQKIEKFSQFVVGRFVWRDREFLGSQGITVRFSSRDGRIGDTRLEPNQAP